VNETRGGDGFEDRLRALGWLLDERGQRLVALALVGDRATVRVTLGDATPEESELNPSDLALLRCTGRAHRGRGDATAPQAGYQGQLRALGRVLDDRGVRACQLRAHGDEFVVQVHNGADDADAWQALRLDRAKG
jgi:hypothetical protein